MANFKKTAAMVGSLAIVGAVAVGGTLANFNWDDEGGMNTLTVGDAVDIAINEYQRDGEGGLEGFEQGKKLYPVPNNDAQGEKDQYGMPVVENYVDKIVTVENTGDTAAWVRVFVAKPAALTDLSGDGSGNMSDDALHTNLGNRFDKTGHGLYNEGKGWQETWNWDYSSPTFTAQIDGVDYIVTCYYLKDALAPDVESLAVYAGAYLDEKVDYDDGVYTMGDYVLNYDFSKGINIPVYAEAIAVTGSEGETYKTAFETRPETDSFKTWATNIKAPVVAESADEVVAALAEDNVVLTGASTVLTTATDLELTNDITASRGDSGSAEKYSALTVASETTLSGTGTVENTAGYGITVKGDGAVLNITGGHYVAQCTAINVVKGTLKISGGTFEVADDDAWNSVYLINCIDANYNDGSAKVEITGGTFKNWNPANNASEGAGTNYVPAGYTVTESAPDANGNIWYTVVAAE